MRSELSIIKEHLELTYPDLDEGTMNAIIKETLEKSDEIRYDLRHFANLRHGECDGAGYVPVIIEPIKGFDSSDFANKSKVVLGSRVQVGHFKITTDSAHRSAQVEITNSSLEHYPEGTPLYGLVPAKGR